jgi:hypothetical protein
LNPGRQACSSSLPYEISRPCVYMTVCSSYKFKEGTELKLKY